MTEACILTDTPYEEKWHLSRSKPWLPDSPKTAIGPVIAGITQGQYVANFCYEAGKPSEYSEPTGLSYPAQVRRRHLYRIIAADAVNSVPFDHSVKKASNFIKKCIQRSIELDIPLTDGVCFEEVLHTLKYN
ncbi:MAG: hypothetical protein ACLS2X_06815 [Coprococcus sp.]